jgi:hypothetical protein
MADVVPGVIHGKTIELEHDPGLADGAAVEVTIRRLPDLDAQRAAILRTAGAWANDVEMQAALADVERARRSAAYRDEDAG